MSSRLVRNSVVLVVLAVFGLALLWTYIVDNNTQPPYTYSQMLADAKAGHIKSVSQDGTKLTVQFNTQGTAPQTVVVPDIGNIDVQQDVCTAAGAPSKADCQIDYGAVEASAVRLSGCSRPAPWGWNTVNTRAMIATRMIR